MKKREQKPPFPWTSFGVLIFVALLLLAIMTAYTKGEKKRLIENASKEIEAVAKLKSDQIERWRLEKINDAKLIYENRTLVNQVETFFISNDNKREKLLLTQYLTSILRIYDFGSALLRGCRRYAGAFRTPGSIIHGRQPPEPDYLRHSKTGNRTVRHSSGIISQLPAS